MMKSYAFLLICSLVVIQAAGQNNSRNGNKPTKVIINTKQPSITTKQQEWVKSNYKKVSIIPRDSAVSVVRTQFPGVSDPSLEYLIEQAGKLAQEDQQKQLAELQQELQELKLQKAALMQKMKQKESEIAGQEMADEIAKLEAREKEVEYKISLIRRR